MISADKYIEIRITNNPFNGGFDVDVVWIAIYVGNCRVPRHYLQLRKYLPANQFGVVHANFTGTAGTHDHENEVTHDGKFAETD